VSLLDDDVLQEYDMMHVSPMAGDTKESGRSEENTPRESSFGLEVQLFHFAIRQGNSSEIIQKSDFLDELVNEMDPNTGEMPLHMAVRSCNLEITSILLEYDAAANCQDLDGNTPLHIACKAELVALLLDKGRANPNIPNAEGVTALHFAVQRRDSVAVQHMLQAGADVSMADNTKWFTPLHVISHPYPQIGYVDSTRYPDEITVSTRAQITRLLCDVMEPSTADPNCGDWEGNTPLHHAVTLSDDDTCDVLRILLEKGGNPNAVNQRGQTPLHLLCHNDSLRNLDAYQEMLHDMLSNGADPNKPSNTGCTALHLSLYHKNIDSAVQLIHSGAQLNLVWKKVSYLPVTLSRWGLQKDSPALLIFFISLALGRRIGTTWEIPIPSPWIWSLKHTTCTECLPR
jgi:ankyrin repeat protein